MHREPSPPWQYPRRRAVVLFGTLAAVVVVASSVAGVFLLSSGSSLGGAFGELAPGGAPGAGGASNTSTSATPPAPSLVAEPSAAVVGANVTLNATDFAHSVDITITGPGASSATVCSGKTTSKGAFGCVYQIPKTIGGLETFNATTTKNGKIEGSLTVLSSVYVNPKAGLVGTTVHVHAYGYGGKEFKAKKKAIGYPVAISYTGPAGTPVTVCEGNTSTSLNGSYWCSFVLAPLSVGKHTIHADAVNQSYSATTKFDVVSGLTDGPTYGPIGTTVTFSGSGFGPSEEVDVGWTYGGACSGDTLSSGSFSCAYTIPVGSAGGNYTFRGTASNNSSDSASVLFVLSYLDPSVVSGPVGTEVTFTGGGFVQSHAIAISWTGGPICPGTESTPSGTFVCHETIPAVPGGAYTFTATDDVGDSASAEFTVEPSLVLSPTYGEPNTPVEFTGTGFGAVVPVNVSWSPSGLPVPACSPFPTTASDGNFSCTFTIPPGTAGAPYTFTATDTVGDRASATFVVTYLDTSPSSGTSGPKASTIALSGGGFTPGKTFTVTWAGHTLSASDCTSSVVSATGTFHCSYTTNSYVAAGPAPFEAVDAAGLNATGAFRVTPHLALSLTTVGPGPPSSKTNVTFAATGFGARTTVTILWPDGTNVCVVTTSGGGAANCTIAITAATAGSYVFNATDAEGHTAIAVLQVLPDLSVKPASGPTGTVVHFVGRGFAANSAVTVSSSLGAACGPPTSTATNGTFVCAYTLPQGQAGPYTFTATDAQSDSATATFTLAAALTVSPSRGPVGTLVTFTGAGFAPGHLVNVTWAKGLACTGTASASGGFSCSVTIPSVPKATYVFTACDNVVCPASKSEKFADSATGSYTVVPSLEATPSSGAVGTAVTFSGRGYLASQTVYVNGTGGNVCSALADAAGAFSCSYTIPASGAGTYSFTGASSPKIEANATFTVLSALTLRPSSGPVETTVEISATGLAASASVNIDWSGGTACTGTSSSTGAFSCAFALPASPAGTYVFSAVVASVTVATATFVLTPSLSVSPTSGPVGTSLTFDAYGFGSARPINITSSLGTACSGTTLSDGSYSCSYSLPSAPSGSYTFTALDSLGNEATVSFGVGAVLSVTPAKGPVGTPIAFLATGFAASTSMTIGWSGGTVCMGTTGPAGRFSCNTTMPAAPLGATPFTATAGPSTSATFTVVPSLAVSPASGGAGTSATFYGKGFPATTGVTVSWSGPTTCSATTQGNGSFSCAVAIPSDTAGAVYVFTARDDAGDQATVSFTVVTGLTVTPAHGPATTTVTFHGSNFAASVAVTVSWSGGTACPPTTTLANGSFSCSFTIPSGTAGGPYNFTASGGGKSVSALFVVTYLSATPNGLEAGDTVTLSGGGFEASAPFTVAAPWGMACVGTASAAGTISCRTTVPADEAAGVYSFDANDSFADVAHASFAVFTISAPSATPASVDLHQNVRFSETASDGGGSASVLTYTWVGLPAGCAGITATVTCTPSASVLSTSITVTVNNSLDESVTSPALLFSVYADPTQAPPHPSPPAVDLGGSVTFTAEVENGSGGGTYAWLAAAGLDCTPSSGAVLSCAPGASGSFSVSYNWTDSNGVLATGSTVLHFVVGSLPSQAPPEPSQASADVGQSVRFSAVVSGGSRGGSYAWSASASLDCAASTGEQLNCTPSAVGNYSVSYVWTDGSGVKATGTTALTYQVYGDPTVGTPSASVGSADVGQSVTFSVHASGGSGGLTYSWNDLPANCTGAGASFSCRPSAAVSDAQVTVTVTDSNGFAVTSAALAFTVYSDPIVGAPSASVASADVGQKVTFSVVASGGSGALSYAWHNLPGCTGAGASFGCTATSPETNASITVTVTDPNGFSVTSSALVFTVYADPQQAPPTSSRPAADIGQSVSFAASTTYGSGGGTYAWSASSDLNCTASVGPVLSCRPNASGAFSVSYAWTDSNGLAATGTTVLSFLVSTDPTVALPTPSPSSVDVRQTVTFDSSMNGGAGTPTFTWTTSAPGINCTLGSGATLSCVPASAGSYTVSVYVTDGNGVVSPTVESAAFTVYSDPSVTAPNPSHLDVDVGESLTFTTVGSGGLGTLTFTWTAPSELGCSASSTDMLVCVPTDKASGPYTVSVTATDENKFVSAAATSPTVTVSVAPSTTTPSPSRTSADVGQSVTFSTTASGGSGVYLYSWSGSTGPTELNCTVADAPSLVCVPAEPGTYSVTVTVTDSNGAASAPETLGSYTIYADPTVTVPVPRSTSTDVGQDAVWSVVGGNGSGPLTYTWQAPVGFGCILHTTDEIGCLATLPGTYTVNVTATDPNGATSKLAVSAPFTVYAKPSVVLTISPAKVLEGHGVTIKAVVTGGSGGLTYVWKGLPSGCPSAPTSLVFSCTPKASGNFSVSLLATDSNKGFGNETVILDVQPSFLGLPAIEGYELVVGLVLGGIAAAVVVLVLRARKRRGTRLQHEF